MASAEDVASVRRMAAEALTDQHTDDVLSALLDSKESPEAAAAQLWQEAAGRYSKLVNTSESGSSRANGQLHQNMLTMAKHYSALAATDPVVAAADAPFTTAIERA